MSTEPVSLVIPGRNCASTIEQCLAAVTPLLETPAFDEIIFVDDGSADDTLGIVREFPVRCISGEQRGPGAARNIGWRAARNPLVWFIDADCVAEPDALSLLLPELDDPAVGAVSGSYGIMNPESCLARLIHEEIIERHRAMPRRVNFLATFNVIYRWDLLERVGGFNERYLKAQDAELSFRVMAEGAELRFVFESRVKHYHATRLLHYLRTQQQQGYWRVWLHLDHRGHAAGDAYSSLVDHLQPPLAMLAVAFAAFLVPTVLATRIAWPRAVLWIPVALVAALAALQLPMTLRLWRRLRELRYLLFAPLGFARAFWRGVGMIHGLAGYLRARVGDRPRPQASTSHHA